jgi:uracil-DNA glycosylase family 4
MIPESPASPFPGLEPSRDCPFCPRLVAYREALRVAHPGWWNAPVRVFGDRRAWLGIVGLAPGKGGANRTGRAFLGDQAGDTLCQALARHGLTRGDYRDGAVDGFVLEGVAIVNPVRCAPPGNRPLPAEIASCRRFLDPVIAALDRLLVLVALGRIAHQAVLRAAGVRPSAFPFSHFGEHVLPDGRILIDSYHCSRLNTNTGRLTPAMFDQVFVRALSHRRST